MKNGELIGEMIAWEAGCPRRIDHFLKVYGLVNCTPKVGQESQRKGCRNLWEKNCSVRN